VPDLWLTDDQFVGKLSAVGQPTRPTQPSIPLRGLREWIQLNSILRLRMSVWLQVKYVGLGFGCTSALSVTQSAASAVVRLLWRYIRAFPFNLPFCLCFRVFFTFAVFVFHCRYMYVFLLAFNDGE